MERDKWGSRGQILVRVRGENSQLIENQSQPTNFVSKCKGYSGRMRVQQQRQQQ